MARSRTMPSTIRVAAAISLAAAAGGIGIQIIGGADYPTVPPGVLILLAAAAVMGFVRWPWAPLIATVATLFISVGAVLAPNLRNQLADPNAVLVFVGSGLQVVTLLAALILGAFAIREAFIDRRSGMAKRPSADARSGGPHAVGPDTSVSTRIDESGRV